MDSFEKTEAKRLTEIEKEKRRIQRISQVRQQANSWSSKSRQNFEAEKQRSLKALISEVAAEVTNAAVRNLEELSRNHITTVGEIGQAHRAAANYPNYNEINEYMLIENNQRAKARHSEALRRAKAEELQHHQEVDRLKRIRESVRVEEDLKAKSLVERRPFRPKNIETKPESMRDKLRRQGYQQSLANTLHVPGKDNDTEIQKSKKVSKKRVKHKLSHKRRKSPKSKPRMVHRIPPLELAAKVRATQEPTTVTTAHPRRDHGKHSPRSGLNRHRSAKPKPQSSPDDVLYVSANVPLPPQKYKAPPGLAQRVTVNPSMPTAWDQAKVQNEQQEREEKETTQVKSVVQKKTKQRGRKALKIARLEQRYKQLTTELMSTIDEEEEEIDLVVPPSSHASAPPSVNQPNIDFITRLNTQYEKIMEAAKAQMASLMEDNIEELEILKVPEWRQHPNELSEFVPPLRVPTITIRPPSVSEPETSHRPPPSFDSLVVAPRSNETVPDAGVTVPVPVPTSSPVMYREIHRKQQAMKAYLTVKEKLLELEEELQRRELNLLTTMQEEQNLAEISKSNENIQPSSPKPASAQQIPSATVPNSEPPSVPASPPKTVHVPTVRKPLVESASVNLPEPNVNVGTMQSMSIVTKAKVPRLKVKKSQSKITLQRKRSKLFTAGAVTPQKKTKENEVKENEQIRKDKSRSEVTAPGSSRIPVSTEASHRILRHYIEKLLMLEPGRAAELSTSRTSSISNSSNIQINSSAISIISMSKSNSLASLNMTSPFGKRPPQDASTPNVNKTSDSRQKTGESFGSDALPLADSTSGSSFPDVDLNIIYDSDSTKSKSNLDLVSPVPRSTSGVTPSQGELRHLLANVCQRQAYALSASTTQRGGPSTGRSADEEDAHAQRIDADMAERFRRLMSNGSSSGSGRSSDERRLRGGTSTLTRSSPRSPLAIKPNDEVSGLEEFLVSPLSVTGVISREERIPQMIGQVADNWRQISIERPEWLD